MIKQSLYEKSTPLRSVFLYLVVKRAAVHGSPPLRGGWVGPYGTGSYPLPPHGWQRPMRLMVSQNPLNKPYFLKASNPYCEQVGENRHCGPNKGEIVF